MTPRQRIGRQKASATRLGITHEVWLYYNRTRKKHCYSCRQWLDVRKFSRKINGERGRQSECKLCAKIRYATTPNEIPNHNLDRILRRAA